MFQYVPDPDYNDRGKHMLQMLNLDAGSMSVFPSTAVIWTNTEATL